MNKPGPYAPKNTDMLIIALFCFAFVACLILWYIVKLGGG